MVESRKLDIPITRLDLSVRNKLYIGFALIAVLAAAIGVVGFTQLNAVNAEYDYILFKLNVIKDCSDEMVVEVRTAVEAATEYVAYSYGDKSALIGYNAANEEFDNLELLAEETAAAAEEQTAAMNQLASNAGNLEEIATQLQAEMAKFQL